MRPSTKRRWQLTLSGVACIICIALLRFAATIHEFTTGRPLAWEPAAMGLLLGLTCVLLAWPAMCAWTALVTLPMKRRAFAAQHGCAPVCHVPGCRCDVRRLYTIYHLPGIGDTSIKFLACRLHGPDPRRAGTRGGTSLHVSLRWQDVLGRESNNDDVASETTLGGDLPTLPQDDGEVTSPPPPPAGHTFGTAAPPAPARATNIEALTEALKAVRSPPGARGAV